MGNTISGSEITEGFVVTYDEGDNFINTEDIAPNYQDIRKFKVTTDYNESQEIIIQLAALLNTTNGNYNLYTCSQSNYNNATYTNVSTNCTRISATNESLPTSGTIKKVHTATKITLAVEQEL